MSLCLHFADPSLHTWLGAVPTVAQPAARWGRRHACNLAELSLKELLCLPIYLGWTTDSSEEGVEP